MKTSLKSLRNIKSGWAAGMRWGGTKAWVTEPAQHQTLNVEDAVSHGLTGGKQSLPQSNARV